MTIVLLYYVSMDKIRPNLMNVKYLLKEHQDKDPFLIVDIKLLPFHILQNIQFHL